MTIEELEQELRTTQATLQETQQENARLNGALEEQRQLINNLMTGASNNQGKSTQTEMEREIEKINKRRNFRQ